MYKINLTELRKRVVEEGRHPTVNEGVLLISYVERLTRILAKLEWLQTTASSQGITVVEYTCPVCYGTRPDHEEDCDMASVMKNAKGLLEDANAKS